MRWKSVRLLLQPWGIANQPTFACKKGEPQVHEAPPPLKIGKGFTVRVGKDLALLSVGNMLPVALDCAENHSYKEFPR